MKKIIAFTAALLLSTSVIFASEKAFHVGGAIPAGSLSDGNDDCSLSGFDFYADFTRIADSGFTFNITLAAGTSTLTADGEDLDLTNCFLGGGLGYSFIHDEKKTLSLTGDLGFLIMSGDKNVYPAKIDYSATMFYIGPKVAFTYKFLKHLGIFANAGLYYASGSWSTTIESTVRGISYSTSDDGSISGIIFRPDFGVAIPF